MNVKTSVTGNVLTIVCEVSKETLAAALPSKTGKTRSVATTHGFTHIGLPGGATVGLSLNLTTK